MLNGLFLYILILFFIYAAFFTVYFCMIVIASFFSREQTLAKDLKKQYKNIIVIVYSHNNEKTVVNLSEQLNKQTYPKANYQTHIILDNCTDNSANKLEFVGGAKLWRMTDDEPLGRDKAISGLLENLMSFKKIDAYVFLNATRNVRPDFLEKVNEALQENSVIVGSTEILLEDADFYDNVWAGVNKYNTDIMKLGRTNLGLAVPVDSDITVIKQDVLKKVRCIDFKDANSELKYSFLLTGAGFVPKFVPEVKTYVSSINYVLRRPSFGYKLSLFSKCFSLKSFSDFKFAEFMFSLLKPNPAFLTVFIILTAVYSANYYFFVDFAWSIVLAVALAAAFIVSVYKSDLYFKPLVYLAFCPFYTFRDFLCENKFIKKLFIKAKKQQINKIERISVPVTVTNGKRLFPCSLDLISEDGFKKAVFRYKNKKQETMQSYVRMCDAVKNIADILDQHGFTMMICHSCAHFAPKVDGTNNMVKGYCNKKAEEMQNNFEAPETLLWSTCENFLMPPESNVIDITGFVKKN